MVGTNTALHDNPQLNARLFEGKNPIRVLIDKNLTLPQSLHLFDHSIPTLCYNMLKSSSEKNLEYIKLNSEKDPSKQILNNLYEQDIQSIIIEGGGILLKDFISKDLWDEARVFVGNKTFEEGISAPKIDGHLVYDTKIENDHLQIIRSLG